LLIFQNSLRPNPLSFFYHPNLLQRTSTN
jgi:hypothetical protein